MPLVAENNSEILRKLRSIGLTQEEVESPIITDEPKLPNYICLPNISFDSEKIHGQGFDLIENRARIKSVAECLERICLFNPKTSSFLYSKFEGQKEFVNPLDFVPYSDKQIDRDEYDFGIKRNKLSWWPAVNLFNNSTVFVPAQLLFLSHDFDTEFPIRRERISTGSAFGKHGESRALHSGFSEIIERDAIMGAYLMKKRLPIIRNLPTKIVDLLNYFKRYNLETYIFDATSDLGIPVVMSLVLDRTGIGEAVNLGAKSGRSYLECIEGSMFEAIQPRRAARMIYILNPEKLEFDDSKEIKGMEERYAFWRSINRIKDLDFWLNSNLNVDYKSISKKDMSLKNALEIINNRGYSLFVSDITLPRIKDSGFETLKVLIPELHPLYLAENAKALHSVHYGNISDDPQLKPHPFT